MEPVLDRGGSLPGRPGWRSVSDPQPAHSVAPAGIEAARLTGRNSAPAAMRLRCRRRHSGSSRTAISGDRRSGWTSLDSSARAMERRVHLVRTVEDAHGAVPAVQPGQRCRR